MPDESASAGVPRRAYESPLRERQAQQTRDQILDALTELLGDRRADEVTTKDLASLAGVSERTVYRHFPDRAALVEGLTARLGELPGRGQLELHAMEDLQVMAVELMAGLETRHVEARAEAVFNADPRGYSDATRRHTLAFSEAVGAALPGLDEEQHRSVAALVRTLLSAQAWLRMREEFGITGDRSGPIIGWAIDALVHEVQRGNAPPPAT